MKADEIIGRWMEFKSQGGYARATVQTPRRGPLAGKLVLGSVVGEDRSARVSVFEDKAALEKSVQSLYDSYDWTDDEDTKWNEAITNAVDCAEVLTLGGW